MTWWEWIPSGVALWFLLALVVALPLCKAIHMMGKHQ